MSQYSHESMPDANLKSGSFFSFEDMTSQNFPLKRGTIMKSRYLHPENGFNFGKMSFCVQTGSFRFKI